MRIVHKRIESTLINDSLATVAEDEINSTLQYYRQSTVYKPNAKFKTEYDDKGNLVGIHVQVVITTSSGILNGKLFLISVVNTEAMGKKRSTKKTVIVDEGGFERYE